jgi:hypothetical protein
VGAQRALHQAHVHAEAVGRTAALAAAGVRVEGTRRGARKGLVIVWVSGETWLRRFAAADTRRRVQEAYGVMRRS